MSFVMEKQPGEWERRAGEPEDPLRAGLQDLTLCVIRMAAMMVEMTGRQRPELDHIAADLMDVAKQIGLQHPDAPNPRPTSAWPEGEGRE